MTKDVVVVVVVLEDNKQQEEEEEEEELCSLFLQLRRWRGGCSGVDLPSLTKTQWMTTSRTPW